MAIVYFSYLFDSEAFLKKLEPILPETISGNYGALEEIAAKTMVENPELWEILENWFLGPPEKDEEDNVTPDELFTRIGTQFLEPFYESAFAWNSLRAGLASLNWSEYEIHLLLYGKSLCSLFEKTLKNRPYEAYKRNAWCDAYFGYLDLETMIELKTKLIETKESRNMFFENPHELQEKMDGNSSRPISYNLKSLSSELSVMISILTDAIESGKALAMAEA